LFLAHWLDWHAPFLVIVVVGTAAGLVMMRYMRPVTEHLHMKHDLDPWTHLGRTFLDSRHTLAFITTMILATGGFMMMPFSTTFLTNNVGIPEGKLTFIFMFVGLASLFTFPLVGRASDRVGRVTTFTVGTLIAMVLTIVYTHLGHVPMWQVIVINATMFAGIASRIVSSSALMSAIPDFAHRGAFMSINSSIQLLLGAGAAGIAGLVVKQSNESAPLEHFDLLGYICCGTMLACIVLIYFVNKQVKAHAPPTSHSG
jgi:predicted MFS family arabinose efflux permease